MIPKLHPLPDREQAQLARESAQALSNLLGRLPKSQRARVSLDGNDIILPAQALALLRELLVEMAQGNAVTIVPTHAELTTQEAANVLNVSRPYIVKLLEQGEIAYTKAGTHRRIRYQDLMAYRAKQHDKSLRALDALAAQAQELRMGY
jgi:excisionase family DNA binding protein